MPYIVHTNETIDGIGDTADAAWADMQREMTDANVAVLAEPPHDTYPGAWTLERNFRIAPATEALIEQVRNGNTTSWRRLANGVCGTTAEYEAQP